MTTPLNSLLETKQTLIVVGPGGVGKTTTSAALALQGARLGMKVLVLTVDPAKRLATSMGLEALSHEPARVAPGLFAAAGVSLGSGALYAMMLDTKSTFDAVIERHAPDPAVRDRILTNRFYQQTSSALAGSQEYMAMEKLYEIREAGDYDLVVLDTPPTTNALDFFTAPDRLEGFLDSSSLRVLLASMRTASRFSLGFLRFNSLLLRVMNRFIGTDVFLNLLEFVESFHEMFEGFKDRARRVRAILRSDDVAFAVVTSTDRIALDEGRYLYELLAQGSMPFGAFLVNRVRPSFIPADDRAGLEARLREAARGIGALSLADRQHVDRLCETTARACEHYAVLADVDLERVAALRADLGADAERVHAVPLFEQDIHDLRGLAAFADVVCAET